MTRLLILEGTWGSAWARDFSPEGFRSFLTAQGFHCSIVEWSTNVDGLPDILNAKGHRDWISGAWALRYFLRDMPYEERNILCHSHGIGPALYQAAIASEEFRVWPIRRLLSVCSPPRKDLEAVAVTAVQNHAIGNWRHIYAAGWDSWARLGQMFDGHWGWRRKWDIQAPDGVFNQIGEKGIGHSEIFSPDKRQRFIDSGHFDFLHARA